MKTLVLVLVFCSTAIGSAKPLFHSGQEAFKVVDGKGKTPVFKILNGSMTKKSLAIAVHSAWKLSDSKSEVKPYVEMRFQKVILRPKKDDSEKIRVAVHVSGYEMELEPAVLRADLTAEKTIAVKLAPTQDSIALFSITSKGELIFKFDKKSNSLLIERAQADLEIENPMSEDETERVKFTGKALRL